MLKTLQVQLMMVLGMQMCSMVLGLIVIVLGGVGTEAWWLDAGWYGSWYFGSKSYDKLLVGGTESSKLEIGKSKALGGWGNHDGGV